MCGANLSRNALRVPKEEEGMTYEELVLVIRPISDEAVGFQNACIRSCSIQGSVSSSRTTGAQARVPGS